MRPRTLLIFMAVGVTALGALVLASAPPDASAFASGVGIALVATAAALLWAVLTVVRAEATVQVATDAMASARGRLRALEETAARDEAQLRTVLGAMSDGVVLLDAQRRLRAANPAAEALFGFRLTEVGGETAIIVLRRHEIDAMLSAVEASGVSERQELEQIFPARRILRVTVDPLPAPGGFVVLAQDLTEARRLELVRRDFVANVSHELRTPLASLRAMTETLMGGGLDDAVFARRFFGQMLAEIERLSRLVGDLLDLSMLESEGVRLRRVTVPTRDLLEGVARRFSLDAATRSTTLTVEADEAIALTADRDRLEQAVSNLVENALKYTPTGSHVRLSAARSGDAVQIVVEDDGPGIPAAHLQRVFERFYRADPSRSRRSGGTGLGLAIVKHVVSVHGGRAEAFNRPEGGARFVLTLPA
ncbi:MAG: PAS domain-containing protein [Armatimonadetes bacterium]|nr:PAS domain-containing protein [Armatimonadota bacterium]